MDMNIKRALQALESEIPHLQFTEKSSHLDVRWRTIKTRIPWADVSSIPSRVRKERINAGEPFLDTQTGTLHVSTESGCLLVEARPRHQRLTPFQCALLARLLDYRAENLTETLQLPDLGARNIDIARRLSDALQVDIGKVAITRCLKAYEEEGILDRGSAGTPIHQVNAVKTLVRDFTLSSLGKQRAYREHRGWRKTLQSRMGPKVMAGVSWAVEVQHVLIRTIKRVPLPLLALHNGNPDQFSSLHWLLAAADGVRSDDPLIRSSSKAALARWDA